MAIFLGDLSVAQIEHRLGIELSAADKEYLAPRHQGKVMDTHIEPGFWHCFDIPLLILTHDKGTAEIIKDLFNHYEPEKFKESFQIGWEK